MHENTIYGSLYGTTKVGTAKTDLSGTGDSAYVYIEGCSSEGSPLHGLVGEIYGDTTAYIRMPVGENGTPTTWHSGYGCDHLSGGDKIYLWITE